uniref:5-formyltetrahydrofolate cyclo-ligase n=1 Tax=Anopheles funestus TaxID=62324 RepID=A0A182RHU8_ANOFN
MVASEAEDDVQKNSPPAAENNEDSAPTKRFYRMEVWAVMKPLFPQGSAQSRYVNKKIPLFPQAEQTAERLAETTEFKDAKNIKVNIDMAQESVKLQVLKANKTLFVAPSQKSDYLYAKIKLPCSLEEVPLVQQRRIVKMLAGNDTYEELGIDQTEPLDMVVVGCVAVSERGQRIGKGNGYVDLEIGILQSLGVITPKTVIATTVADEQVYKELPTELFQNYDFTVDLIVTPTRVIRVDPRPNPRAIDVQWGLLSSRRLDVVRVLKKLKERLEKEGQHIELKDEDTDVESFAKRRTRGNDGGGGGGQQERRRQQNRRRRSTRNSNADGHNETKSGNERHDNGEENESGEVGDRMRRKRRFFRKPRDPNRFRTYASPDSAERVYDQHHRQEHPQRQRKRKGGRIRPTKPRDNEDEDLSDESRMKMRQRTNQGSQQGGTRPARQEPRQPPRHLRDGVRIRVSNMYSVPFKEFKEELRNRDCYPAKISQSRHGRCLLIYPKRTDLQDQVQEDELLQKLADMRISVPLKNSTELKQIKLKCEVQRLNEFDDTDATAITSAVNSAAKRAADACTKLAKAAENPKSRVNVDKLVTVLKAEVRLAARAGLVAGELAQKVLNEAKADIEAETGKQDSVLQAQVEAVTLASNSAFSASALAEVAYQAIKQKSEPADTVKVEGDDASKVDGNVTVKVEPNDTPKVEANVAVKVEANDAVKVEANDSVKVEANDATKAEETAGTVTVPAPLMEAATEASKAVLVAARASAAVSLAVAKLYELVPPKQPMFVVASVQTLTRLFPSLLPEDSTATN